MLGILGWIGVLAEAVAAADSAVWSMHDQLEVLFFGHIPGYIAGLLLGLSDSKRLRLPRPRYRPIVSVWDNVNLLSHFYLLQPVCNETSIAASEYSTLVLCWQAEFDFFFRPRVWATAHGD